VPATADHELITWSSTAAMNLLGLDSNVLAANDPLNWNDIPSFQQAAALVKSLKVVNDAAERSVALPSFCWEGKGRYGSFR